MCGRYDAAWPEVESSLRAVTGDARLKNLPPDGSIVCSSGEIFPSQVAAVIANNRRMAPCAFAMQWGFRRSGQPRPLINARAETAAVKPMFAESAKNRRCLIPLSHYYEWEVRNGGRIKHAIRPSGAGRALLAGLYRLRPGALPEFVVLTRPATDAIRFIHDRMPVLVAEADARAWLDPANTLEQLLPCALDRVECQEEPAQRGGDPEE